MVSSAILISAGSSPKRWVILSRVRTSMSVLEPSKRSRSADSSKFTSHATCHLSVPRLRRKSFGTTLRKSEPTIGIVLLTALGQPCPTRPRPSSNSATSSMLPISPLASQALDREVPACYIKECTSGHRKNAIEGTTFAKFEMKRIVPRPQYDCSDEIEAKAKIIRKMFEHVPRRARGAGQG